jgi:hypothetical protein
MCDALFPPAGAELEDVDDLSAGMVEDDLTVLGGLLRVVLGGRQQRPPRGEVAVQPRELLHRSSVPVTTGGTVRVRSASVEVPWGRS